MKSLFAVLILILQISAFAQRIESRQLKHEGTDVQVSYTKEIESKSLNPMLEYHFVRQGELLKSVGGINGKALHGSFSRTSPAGLLLVQGRFKDGLKHGKWTLWNEKGQITRTEEYKNGRLHGHVIVFNQGDITDVYHYRHGLKHGQHEVYADGKLDAEHTYKKGELVEEVVEEPIKQIILKEKESKE